ncbi:MAG TPA: PAS domain-containing protein [Pyrinomonadaceae bacterium]|jgi:PAS domain S-box-containing protein
MGDEHSQKFRAGSVPRIDHQLFKALADHGTEFFGISDLNLKPIYVNPAGLARVGLESIEEAAEKSVAEFFFPEDRDYITNEFFGRIERDGRGEVEIRFRHFRTGAAIWMLYTVFVVRDETGAALGYGTVSRDVTERRAMEETIKRSAEQHRNILESITDAFFAIDKNWRFTYLNPQAEQVLSREPGDLVEKVIWEEYPGLVGSKFEEAYRRTMNDGVSSTVTAYYPDHQRWYEVHVYPASDGITVYFRNVTARVETEESLRRMQQETERWRRLYDTILSTTPDLVYVFDLDHRFTYANEVLLKMWGKTWDEAIGKNCLELGYEPWHAEMHDREIEQVKRTKRPIRGEVTFAGTFGRRTYDYIFVPILNTDGEVEAVAGTTRDVTERKQIELRNRFIMQLDEAVRPLETPEEITRTLARLLGEYLGADRCAYAEVEADEDHFFIPGDYTRGDTPSIVGRYAMSSFGAEVLRLMRANKPYVVNDVDSDPQVTAEDLAAYRQTTIRAVICVPLHKNGRFAACMAVHQKAPRAWTEEEIELVSFVSHRFWESIERARAVKSLNDSFRREQEARRSAEAASTVKDEFLATVSHELRTPLNAMLGWATMLRGGGMNSEDAARALEIVERSARAQSQLIDDLLDISRIITGKLRLEIDAIDPTSVVTAAIDAVRPAAEAKGIDLQIVLDARIGTISGDADRLQQVVWNLVSNAVKFTPAGGRVRLGLEKVDSHVEITVSDTGKGIRPEFLPFIFDRFRQADQTTTRRQGGLGLGLSIARQIVEMHGGTVQVESAGEGKGASFVVKLPAAIAALHDEPNDSPSALPAAEKQTRFDEPAELEGLRVLVVDDEADSRGLLGAILEQCRADATVCGSAAEALQALDEAVFDLLISDIGMPEMDGYMLIGKIRCRAPEQGGRLPAIALTAYARAEDRVRALKAGFQTHISKPVEPAELIAVVASVVKAVR